MSKIKISIVTPVYNSSATIGATIESLLTQTYSNWEHICVDDGSTDETTVIIEEYCKRDSRVKLLLRNTLPKGGSSCRNVGAAAASGEFLIFLDGDDELLPLCLENRAKIMADSTYDFAVFRTDYYTTDKYKRKNFCRLYYKYPEYVFAAAQSPWQTSSSMIRTSFFKSINGFNAEFPRLQDVEFHLRALLKSRGNYVLIKDLPADSLYKMDVYEQNVSKLQKSISAYKYFLNLINEELDVLSHHFYRSLSIFVIYCSIIVNYDLLKGQKIRNVSISKDKDFIRLVDYLVPVHKVLVHLLLKTKGNTINYYMAKILRRIALLCLRFVK